MIELEEALVLSNAESAGGYRRLDLRSPAIARAVNPGQFLHLRAPYLTGHMLRRPFSVSDANDDVLTVLFKTVGHGTRRLATARPGETVSALGPLGNTFPKPAPDATVLLVGGGYGIAPLHFFARRLGAPRGVAFIGAASARDVLCAEAMRALGWEVRIATVDGTLGTKGLVTDELDLWLDANPERKAEFYACGPDGMLKALADRAMTRGFRAWVSLDKHMGCGVGACLACVQQVRTPHGIVRVRVCKEGPVFDASLIFWNIPTPGEAASYEH